MRAFVVASGLSIPPFQDPVASLPIGGVPLGLHQERLFSRFGLQRTPVSSVSEAELDEERLITWDDVYFTRRVLKSFLKRWRASGRRPAQLALPAASTFVRQFGELQDFERRGEHALFRIYALPPGAGLDRAEPLPVIYEERIVEVPMPRRIVGVDKWKHPITSSVCFHLRHWVHLLQANRLSIQVRWVDEIVTRPHVAVGILLRALWPFGGSFLHRIMAAANRFGRDVSIHPTARVEGCFLGDGVRVGPQAFLRGSIVGAGTVVEANASITYSVLGERCFVSKSSIVHACMAFDEAELCIKGMQMCVAGRRAALTARVTPIDTAMGHRIRVRLGDSLHELELPVLGSCFGHETYVGAEVTIAAGRAIPNGVRIVPPPDRVLSSVPENLDPDGIYVVEDGHLVPRP